MFSFNKFVGQLNKKHNKDLGKKKKKRPSWKSGGFPMYVDEKKNVFVCMFLSNNSHYGGARPQMPKGHADPGELPPTVAAREASEETGIPFAALKSKTSKVTALKFRGETRNYVQHCYKFVLDKKYPAKKNDEGWGVWMTAEKALQTIRKDQKIFLDKALKGMI